MMELSTMCDEVEPSMHVVEQDLARACMATGSDAYTPCGVSLSWRV